MTDQAEKPLPIDVYVAAQFFLYTGCDVAEVLRRLQLTSARWDSISRVYAKYVQFGSDWDLNDIAALWPDVTRTRLIEEIVGGWQFADPQPSLHDRIRGIRDAVLRKPHIPPFSHFALGAVWLFNDPVAHLCYYSRNDEQVYFNGARLSDKFGHAFALDALNFRHLGGRWYGDGRVILGQGEMRGTRARWYWWPVEGADHATFEALNLRYAKDRAAAWYITGKRVKTNSPATFEVVPALRLNWFTKTAGMDVEKSYVTRDAERVYSYGAAVRGAEPSTFRCLGGGYWSDGFRVWTNDGKTVVDGADAATFRLAGPSDPPVANNRGAAATDRNRPYDRSSGGSGAVDPAEVFEDWRGYFDSMKDCDEWWWHKMERLGRT